jgi:hypothetical protein
MKTSDRTPAAVFTLQRQAGPWQTIDRRPNRPTKNPKESSYSLLIRSEEKARTVFEALTYVFLIWGPLVAMMQFGEYRLVVPAGGLF